MAGDDEARVVVLEGNGVGVVAPVIQIVGELWKLVLKYAQILAATYSPFAVPFNYHVVDDGIETGSNPVWLIFGKHNFAPIATFMKSF
jgi:hypothetical protein